MSEYLTFELGAVTKGGDYVNIKKNNANYKNGGGRIESLFLLHSA